MGNILNTTTPSPGPHLCYPTNPFNKWCQYPVQNIHVVDWVHQAMEYDSQIYIFSKDPYYTKNSLLTAPDTLTPSPLIEIVTPDYILHFSIYKKTILCVTRENLLFYSTFSDINLESYNLDWKQKSTPEPILTATIYKDSISIITTSNKLFIKDISSSTWNFVSNGIKKVQQWDKLIVATDLNDLLQYTVYDKCTSSYVWRSFQTSPVAIEFSLFANTLAILTPSKQVILGWLNKDTLTIVWYPVTTITTNIIKISLYNGLLTLVDDNGNVGIMNYMSTKLNPSQIDNYTYSKLSCLIAPRKPIADSGWGNNYPFFLVDKGWYDIVGQGVKNDYCRFVGGYARDNLACILSKDNINSTSKFNDTNNYSTTYKGQNVLDIAKLQFTPPFPVYSSPQQVTSDGFYRYETADPKREPVNLFTKVNLVDGRNWVRVFSSPFASPATVNEVGKSIPFKGFLIQGVDGSFRTYSYFSTNQLFNTRNLRDTTTGGNKSGFAVYIGYAGGHGFYNVNPIQSPCNWSNSVGLVGAAYDGTCGSFPNALRWGTGQSGTAVCKMVAAGTVWETWITW